MCHTDYMIKELKTHIYRLEQERDELKAAAEASSKTLRDEIAMAALASSNDFYGCKMTSERCYRQADAMLKARDA